MEVVLKGNGATTTWSKQGSFNPCCSGSCSERIFAFASKFLPACFNPCCSGSCSESVKGWDAETMFDSFNPCCSGSCSERGDVKYLQEKPYSFQSLL